LSEGHVDLGVVGQDPQLPFELLRHPDVVRGALGDEVARGGTKSGVVSGRWARVLLLDDSKPVAEALQLGSRSVGRAVVHDDDLPGREGLSEDSLDRRHDPALRVVGGNDDAEGRRRGGHHASLWGRAFDSAR
jgi:hypothetical protein